MNLNWDCPYPSNRSPVFAKNMVAASQPLAVESGVNMLRQGGNAVDAAIATAITLTVVEPNNNGIGSDAFALIHDGNKLHGLNASGRAPLKLDLSRFEGKNAVPSLGWDSVTVPGAVSAWVELSERFGKLPFDTLFIDAIRYAEDGFQVGPKSAYYWRHAMSRFKKFDAFMNTFSLSGRAPAIGEQMRLPGHAATLKKIAATRGESFYQGELAELMAKDAAQHNADMTLEDFRQHEANWVTPISMNAFGADLQEIPPNGQGLMALISLGILKHIHAPTLALDSWESVHLQIEAQRIAYTEVADHLADIAHMKISVDALLEEVRLKRLANNIDPKRATVRSTSMGASPDTVYLSAADESGLMVSMIQSNFRGFGSGIVVPDTGISLQNRGSGFVLDDGHPNQIGPGKRPYHTIIPGFVTQNDAPLMSFGVMGGHMQAQGHLQMMLRVMHYHQNPQAASDAPRWHVFEDGRVALENGFDPSVISVLEDMGHQIMKDQPEHLFGGAQLIVKMRDGYSAGSDHRKEGLATGF